MLSFKVFVVEKSIQKHYDPEVPSQEFLEKISGCISSARY
jgi:hypothetical protein